MADAAQPLHHEFRDPADFHESDLNKEARRIDPKRFDQLKHSLRHDPDMLLARPIIAADNTDPAGEIVGGAQRWKGSLEVLGEEGDNRLKRRVAEWGGLPFYVRSFTKDEKIEWQMRDNADFAEWVPEVQERMVREHHQADLDVSLLGVDEAIVRRALRDEPNGGGDDEDNANETIPEVWGVVIDCDNEQEQQALLERFAEEGLDARALIS